MLQDLKFTAAMDGIDIPGEPWETSIPRIMVGVLETTGMEGDLSIAKREFSPPFWKKKETDQHA